MLDGQYVTREQRAGANTATYLIGAGGPLYRRNDTTNTVRWYLLDGLGSVLGEVDPSGNVTASSKYDVYGGLRTRTGTATTAHGFVGSPGHTSEAETGLIYMRARYMDPVVGRFVSEDPGRNGVNLYVYTSDSPTNRVDSTGKSDDAPYYALGSFLLVFSALLMAGALQTASQSAAALQAQWAKMVEGATKGGGLLAPLGAAVSAAVGFAPLVSAAGGVLTGVYLAVFAASMMMAGEILLALGSDGADLAEACWAAGASLGLKALPNL